jgi:hypothetical protein
MNIRITFPDSYKTAFEYTADEPDGRLIWPNLTQAKKAALAIAIDNREQAAKDVRNIRLVTLADVTNA